MSLPGDSLKHIAPWHFSKANEATESSGTKLSNTSWLLRNGSDGGIRHPIEVVLTVTKMTKVYLCYQSYTTSARI